MRAVAEALKCIAPGTWLFFIDADAAFKASVTPCAPAPSLSPMHCDALAWHGNTTQGRGKCPSSIRALAAFHGNVFRYSGRDPSLLNLWPFGLFAVRHDAFGLDWLERVASRLESELLLCRLSSIPERTLGVFCWLLPLSLSLSLCLKPVSAFRTLFGQSRNPLILFLQSGQANAEEGRILGHHAGRQVQDLAQ